MKIPYFLIILLVYSSSSIAQNLLSNGNFESYSTCPNALVQINYCNGWRQYHGGSSDFFHTCGTGNAGIPNNILGYESPANGNGYSGGLTYTTGTVANYKEYLATGIQPMVIGGRYEVSMSVSLADNSGFGTDDLGAWFYDIGPTTTLLSPFDVLSVTPQASYSFYGPITTKNGWVRLTTKFIADSSYDNIVIGGFKSYTSQNRISVSGGNTSNSYYYIDSIVVQLDNSINISFNDSLLCAGDTFFVPYTTRPNAIFNTSNTFSVQLSNSTGQFTAPLVIGSVTSTLSGTVPCVIPSTVSPGTNYRIRLVSTNLKDSSITNGKNIIVGVTRPTMPNISSNSPLCTGDTLKFTIGSPTTGASYKWAGPSFSSNNPYPAINNISLSNAGQYSIIVQNLGCFNYDTMNVTIHPMPNPISASSNSPVCEPDTIKLYSTNSTPGASYIWNGPNGYNATLQNPTRGHSNSTMSGDYIVTTSLGSHCVQKDTIHIIVKPLPSNRRLTSNTPVCSGQPLTINATSSTSGTNYLWQGPNNFSSSNNQLVFTNAQTSQSGKYVIQYELNGCIVYDSISITIKESPEPIKANSNSPICESSTLVLSSQNTTGDINYHWLGPDNFSANSQNTNRVNTATQHSGKYIVIGTLANGCYTSDSIQVLVKPAPINHIINSNSPVCINDTLKLHASNNNSGVKYSWNGPDNFTSTDSSISIENISGKFVGKYTSIASIGDCKSVIDIDVEVLNPELELGNDLILCEGEEKLLDINIPTATYSWNDGSSDNYYSIKKSGKYWVTATTKCGNISDTVNVEYQLCDCKAILPTAFTPNNDGLNDKFGAFIDCQISSYKFVIINRFGQAVFQSNNQQEKWDGNFKGIPAELGTYFYVLQIKGPLNRNYLFKGDFILIR